MKNNVFEILNDKINYNSEYKKLQKLLLTAQYIPYPFYGSYSSFQLTETFNDNITKFKHRGTYLSINEMINKIEKSFSSNIVLKTLYLCELILNVIDFTDSIVKNHSRSEQMLQLIDNVNIILDKILQNVNQNYTLMQLRDTLLPKLINGDIDLENINI